MALIAFSGPILNSFSCSGVPIWAVFWKLRCGTNSRINLGWPENHLGPKDSKKFVLLDLKLKKLLKLLRMGQFLYVPN